MYSPITGTGTGSAPVVNLSWPFLDKGHVKATVNGSLVGLTWTGASQVTFALPVAAGAAWRVYRQTPSDPLVSYTNGAVLTEADLDLNQSQFLYITEEVVADKTTWPTLVSYLSAGTGATSRPLQDKLSDIPVSPKDFGAVGDGVTDDRPAVLAALTYAFANNRPIDGGAAIYAVSDDLVINSITRPWIRALRLKQTGAATFATLRFISCNKIQIDRLQVDRNVSSAGDMNTPAAGLYIDGGSLHKVSNVEVFGGDDGNGIAIWNTSDSIYDKLHVHDIVYNNPTATDDLVQGIWLYRNTNCSLVDPLVHNLSGNADATYPSRYTRGLTLAGNTRVRVINPTIRDVDQGIDITGSDGNLKVTVEGGHTYQCVTTGVKLANSAVDCKVIGHTAERIGQYAFGAGGPSESGLANKTKGVEFIGCTALDVGYNAFPQRHSGFDVHQESFDTTYPQGVRLIGCRAIDRQATPTMAYGFYNDALFDTGTNKPNELIDCISDGHTTAAQTGFHRRVCRVRGTSTQSVTSGVDTAVAWDLDVDDTMEMHSTTVNNSRITVPMTGRYRVKAKVTFAAVSGGYRRLELALNGAVQKTVAAAVVSGEVTTVFLEEDLDVTAGQYLTILAGQSSGGAVNLDLTQSYFQVELLRQS